MLHKDFVYARGDTDYVALILRVESVTEMGDQRWNVFLSVPKCRQGDLDDPKAIVEILAKGTLSNSAAEITVGAGNDSHVRLYRMRIADSLKLTLLENTQ